MDISVIINDRIKSSGKSQAEIAEHIETTPSQLGLFRAGPLSASPSHTFSHVGPRQTCRAPGGAEGPASRGPPSARQTEQEPADWAAVEGAGQGRWWSAVLAGREQARAARRPGPRPQLGSWDGAAPGEAALPRPR